MEAIQLSRKIRGSASRRRAILASRGGKIEIRSKEKLTRKNLSVLYTSGVKAALQSLLPGGLITRIR